MRSKTCAEALNRLEALGNEKLRKLNSKAGAGDNQFGVKMGDIRAISIGKKVGIYHDYPVSKRCTSLFAPTIDPRGGRLVIITNRNNGYPQNKLEMYPKRNSRAIGTEIPNAIQASRTSVFLRTAASA